jgi:RpiB/LacA/LacB family sugar-phosphate isomerase
MIIVLGSDHAGFQLKQQLLAFVRELGHEVVDVGTDSQAPADYPDFARAVGEAVVSQRAQRGILLCGSGAGAAIAANKIRGVRAALAHDHYTAHQAVEHDDANVLVLGARIVGLAVAQELVEAFLGAQFTREERHQRRLDKVLQIEREN